MSQLTARGHTVRDGNITVVALQMPVAMRAELVRLALLRGASLSSVVRDLLQRGIDAGDERSSD